MVIRLTIFWWQNLKKSFLDTFSILRLAETLISVPWQAPRHISLVQRIEVKEVENAYLALLCDTQRGFPRTRPFSQGVNFLLSSYTYWHIIFIIIPLKTLCLQSFKNILSKFITIGIVTMLRTIGEDSKSCNYNYLFSCFLGHLPFLLFSSYSSNKRGKSLKRTYTISFYHIYPTPPLGQDMTQG